MLRTLLIDDEARARENLRILLQRHCTGDVELIGESENVEKGYRDIVTLKPDLVFLDIEMGKGTGFDLLSRFDHYPFKVIFVTAYDHYAIKAIKFSALDYLLKPVTFDRFLKAVDKASQRFENSKAGVQPVTEKSELTAPPFVFVKDGTKLVKVMWDDILYVEGLKDYVTIHTKTQKVITLQRLKALETQLPSDKFVRVHHSYIVNLNEVEKYVKGEGGYLMMSNGASIDVSRSRKEFLIKKLQPNRQ